MGMFTEPLALLVVRTKGQSRGESASPQSEEARKRQGRGRRCSKAQGTRACLPEASPSPAPAS